MRTLAILVLSVVLLGACRSTPSSDHPNRVLFVGNSQVYVGNLPTVFSALAAANGRTVHSDMIVKGGAALDDRVADGSVARALSRHAYTTVVLQERGGDLMCAFGPDACARSREAVKALADLARQKGARAVLLGSYQSLPTASHTLVEVESSAAADAGIAYIEVSAQLQRLRAAEPELAWFHADGMHPGRDLVLLDAILLYRYAFGSLPQARDFTVIAPIYGVNSGLKPELRPATAPPPKADTRRRLSYAGATIDKLLSVIGPDDR